MILQRPQPRRYPIRSLVEALKPIFESSPRRPLSSFLLGFNGGRLGLLARLRLKRLSRGWRRSGGLSRQGEPPIGDRTRGLSAQGSRARSRPSTLLSRLGGSPSLPSSIQSHLADHPHPLLRSPRDHPRLVDPRLELGQGRHRALRHDPVLSGIPLRSLDTAQFRTAGGGKLARSIDLAAPDRQRTTRGAR